MLTRTMTTHAPSTTVVVVDEHSPMMSRLQPVGSSVAPASVQVHVQQQPRPQSQSQSHALTQSPQQQQQQDQQQQDQQQQPQHHQQQQQDTALSDGSGADDPLSRLLGPATTAMVRGRFEHAKEHWEKEKILLKFNYKVLLVGVLFQYVHSVGTNVAYYLHQQREPLYDLGFAIFPALSREMQVLSEIMFFILVGGTVGFALSPFFVPALKRRLYTTLMLSRFIGVLVLAQSLRVITFLATSLPGPNYHCRPGSTEYNPPQTAHDIFLRQDAFTGCGDLVFSSHTIFVLLCTLTYNKYSDNLWGKRFMWLMVVVFGIMVVAARKHYSIDIVVACYTVPLIWIAYDVYFPDRLPQAIIDLEAKSSQGSAAKDIV